MRRPDRHPLASALAEGLRITQADRDRAMLRADAHLVDAIADRLAHVDVPTGIVSRLRLAADQLRYRAELAA